jgi:hypothetical protein
MTAERHQEVLMNDISLLEVYKQGSTAQMLVTASAFTIASFLETSASFDPGSMATRFLSLGFFEGETIQKQPSPCFFQLL